MTIAVNMYTRDLPYFVQILQGIQKQSKPLGWTIQPTYGNTNPTEQINQIQNAATTHPNAMVVIPVDQNAIIPPIQQAKAAGVPVLTMGDNLAPAGKSVQLSFLGSDYTALGAQKANWIVAQLHGHGTVGFIHGIRGLNFSEAQRQGAMAVFSKNPGIKVVDGGYTGAFTSDTGLKLTEDLLARSPNVNAIYYDNDDIALGGIQALKERNIPKSKVLIVGTDGGPAALAAVKSGALNYTISLCGFRQGKQAVQLLYNYLVKHIQPPAVNFEPDLTFTPATYSTQIKQVQAGNC
jgi:ABC-type sugar transport system substrate-binding protein